MVSLPSHDDVRETRNTSEVLEKIKLSRQYDLMPIDKIRKSVESELICCHVETKYYGYGARRKQVKLQCNKKAAAGNLRCPIHIGMQPTDPKDRIYSNYILNEKVTFSI